MAVIDRPDVTEQMMTSGPRCCSASASMRCLSSRSSKTASRTRAGCAAFVRRRGRSRGRGDAHARPGRRGRRLVDQPVVDHEPQQGGDALGHGRASPLVHFHQPHGVAGQGEDQAGRQADQAGADDDDRAGLVGEWERRLAALRPGWRIACSCISPSVCVDDGDLLLS